MSKATSIRFPDDLRAKLDAQRGSESFHAHVLALCWASVGGEHTAGGRVVNTSLGHAHVRAPQSKPFRPDFKRQRK